MLIRSQNKEALFNLDTTAAFNVFKGEKDYGIEAECLDYSYTIGHYSTEEKALKVLDMIQEAYVGTEVTKSVLRDVSNSIAEVLNTPEGNTFVTAVSDEIIKGMTFQMPSDDEVEV